MLVVLSRRDPLPLQNRSDWNVSMYDLILGGFLRIPFCIGALKIASLVALQAFMVWT